MSKKNKDAGSPVKNKISLDEMLEIYHNFHSVVKKEFSDLFSTGPEPIKKPREQNPFMLIRVAKGSKVQTSEVCTWLYRNQINYTSNSMIGDGIIKIDLSIFVNQISLRALFIENIKVEKKEGVKTISEDTEPEQVVPKNLTNEDNYPQQEEILLTARIEAEEMFKEGKKAIHLIINRFFRTAFNIKGRNDRETGVVFTFNNYKNEFRYSLNQLNKDWEDSVYGKIFQKFESGAYHEFPEFFGDYGPLQSGARGFVFHIKNNDRNNSIALAEEVSETLDEIQVIEAQIKETIQEIVLPSLQNDLLEIMQKHGVLPEVKTLGEYSEKELLDCLCSKITTGEIVEYLVNLGYVEKLPSRNAVLFEIIK